MLAFLPILLLSVFSRKQDFSLYMDNGPIVSDALNAYLAPSETYVSDPLYSYQHGFNYLDASLQPLVQNYMSNYPVYDWPLTVRYSVFPEIYGNIENKILKENLEKLNQMPENQKFTKSINQNKQSKELFDKLLDQVMLKKKIDAQILNSTQLYIEAEELLKKVNAITI